MPNRLNVTLTGTTNPYLIDRLPLDGEIELFEISTRGSLVAAVFRIRDPQTGALGAPVEIAQPAFTYDHQAARDAAFPSATPAETDALNSLGVAVTVENVALLRRLTPKGAEKLDARVTSL